MENHKSHFGFEAVYQAWKTCKRGKRSTRKAQRYEMGLLDNLVNTVDALQTKSWHPSRASRFVTLHPKPREILAADFGDRVVHHLIVPWFEKYFEPVFIHDSFANRKGKGSHAAVERLQGFTRGKRPPSPPTPLPRGEGGNTNINNVVSLTSPPLPVGEGWGEGIHKNRGASGYYLQLDIANFFHSINRRTLFGLLQARIARDQKRPITDARHAVKDEASDMLYVARQLLTGNPALNSHYVGELKDLQRVPAHKQLANAAPEHGLPIGNLSSQFFANVYLNELDQFIKHRLKVQHYVRYVDDFVLLHHSPSVLENWKNQIVHFLHAHLDLKLRDEGKLAPIGNGIDFLGYIVRPHYLLVRQRVVRHMNERLTDHARRLVRRRGNTVVFTPDRVYAVQATLASYFGHFHHAKANRLRSQVWRQHPWLRHILKADAQGQLKRVDYPAIQGKLATQWSYFRAHYPLHVLLMQVGNCWECYWPQGLPQALVFGAKLTKRTGLPTTWQVPAGYISQLKRWLSHEKQAWCEVREVKYTAQSRLKHRQLSAVFPYPSPSMIQPQAFDV